METPPVQHRPLLIVGGNLALDLANTVDALGRPLAYAAWDLLTTGPLNRVKRCPACPWIYLDQSKNSSRRWCTMDDCGKAVKMRRYVAKRAAVRAAVHQS